MFEEFDNFQENKQGMLNIISNHSRFYEIVGNELEKTGLLTKMED